jgi:N6-adenosine-specific RNA methylase IME4
MKQPYRNFSEWKRAGLPLARADRRLMFEIGDWWLAGAVFGRGVRKAIVSTPGWQGPSYDVCRVYGTIARRFPSRLRHLHLDFCHYQAVAPIPDNKLAMPLLERAARENWSVNRIRIAAKRLRWDRPLVGGDIVDDLATLIKRGNKYRAILVDPPWSFEKTTGKRGGSYAHYPAISTDSLCELRVPEVARDDAFLFLWTTSATLEDALRIMHAWGFDYVEDMIWDKGDIGIGYYFRMCHEKLLLGRREKTLRHFLDNDIPSVLRANRTLYAEKPPIVHQIIERATNGPFLEVFGRRHARGWDVVGNQVEPKPDDQPRLDPTPTKRTARLVAEPFAKGYRRGVLTAH